MRELRVKEKERERVMGKGKSGGKELKKEGATGTAWTKRTDEERCEKGKGRTLRMVD